MTDTPGREDRLTRLAQWFAARNLMVGALVAGAAPVGSALLPGVHGWARGGVIGGLVVLALVGFTVPAAKARMAERRAAAAEADAEATSVAMRVALSATMFPLLSYVTSGVDPSAPDKAEETVGGAIQGVLAAASKLCGGAVETRACWYKLETDTTTNLYTLVPTRHYGRSVRPSTRFSSNEARGIELLDLLSRDHTELWSNLAARRPDDWKPTRNDMTYQGCLVVPVRTEHQVFGLLMVDVDAEDVLGPADVSLAQLLASILALALSHQPAAQQLPNQRVTPQNVAFRSPVVG